MKNKSLVVLIITVLTLGLLVSMGVAQEKNELVVAKGAPVRNLYPNAADVDATLSAVGNMYEGLTRRKADGEQIPGLATSWERLGLYKWKFNLRKDVTFWNGNAFTAEDVKFSFNRLASDYPKLGKFSEFTYTGNRIKEIRTPDKYTVIIETKVPHPILLSTSHQIFMMDKQWTKKMIDEHSASYLMTHTMGTGPYELVEWKKGDHLSLKANEDYWGGEPPIKKVTIRPISEASTRMASLVAGKVDLVFDLPVKLIKQVKAKSGLKVVGKRGRRIVFFGIDANGPKPLGNKKVRKAIYMSINEQAIKEKVMFGHATPVAQIVDPATFGFNPDIERTSYNPEKAKELLKEAGYGDGFKLQIDVPYDRYVQDEQIGQAVASMLKKVGITASVHSRTRSVHFSRIIDGKTKGLFMVGWLTGVYDAGRPLFQHVHSPNPEKGYGSWNPGIRDQGLDELIEETPGVADTQKRKETLQEAMKMTIDNYYFIPLHAQHNIWGADKDLNFSARSDNWFVAMECSWEE